MMVVVLCDDGRGGISHSHCGHGGGGRRRRRCCVGSFFGGDHCCSGLGPVGVKIAVHDGLHCLS